MKTHPTLYKRTQHGKVQIWYMESDGAKYRTVSGQQDGVHTTSEWTTCKPKNLGRANATTAEEQCQSRVDASYEYRLARDYHRELVSVDEITRFKPMLASKWQDFKDRLPNEVSVQPKLDGIRCIVNKDGMWTREGKPIIGAPHIFDILKPLFEYQPHLVVDGELYNHDLKDDFNKIISCVRKTKPTDDDLLVSKELIQYHIYDLPYLTDRGHQLRHEHMGFLPVHDSLVIVKTILTTKDNVDALAADLIAEGYEGAMIRDPNCKYENKRSRLLLKWKEFQDDEFKIVDILPGEGNASGYAARVVLELPNGNTFSSGMIGNQAYCASLLLNKAEHIGKLGTVVFQNYTPDGVPRFPKFKGVRDYD
jgi:DNA ligase-1